MTIGEQVLNVLKSRTTEVQDVVDKMRELEDRKKNDHLDQKYIRDVLDPKLTELRVKRGNIKNLTEAEIRKMTEEYMEQVRNSHRLNGGELTDDARLLSFPGLLRAEDVDAIMDRSQGNHTMLQLAARYAEQNGLKINRVYDSGKAAEIKAVTDLQGVGVLYIKNWMDSNRAQEMLEKFFIVR